MKKIIFSTALFFLAISTNAQMKSKYTNVTSYGGHDGTIDLRIEGGKPPYTYLWNDGSIEEDRTNLKSGVYTVMISDNSECNVTVSFNITQPELFFKSANALNHFTSQISVFPNPTEGDLNIHLTSENQSSFLVRITDLNGRIISERKYGKLNGLLNEKIDLSKQSKGIYIVEVINEYESFASKVVLQ